MKNLQGKRALITGAASGIGQALALRLAAEGVHVYLLDIDQAGAAATAQACRARGVVATAERCDLSQPDEIDVALATLLARWEYVDLLVNNAGVAYYGPTENMTTAQWDWLMAINLLAPLRITRALLPTLLARPESHLLNVCSISGLVAGGRFAAYHVSKFGLVGFSEAMRAEYGRRGLGVTALCPGPVATNLYRDAVSGRAGRAVPQPPRWLCATPERVAARGVAAIRRNRGLVLVTPLAYTLYYLKRAAPWLLDLASQVSRKRRPTAAVQAAPPPSFDAPTQQAAAPPLIVPRRRAA
jgi:NAD(P)-dependent dehydrogenase (short-subunit alcohol dehydrogenase family)